MWSAYAMRKKRSACLSKLWRKLEKENDANKDSMKINKIVSDISKLLNNETSFETSFETNQEILGMRNVFRWIVIKSWTGNDFDTSEDRKNNKTIVKESVLFNTESWVDRCKALHDEEEKKKRLSQWYGNLFN